MEHNVSELLSLRYLIYKMGAIICLLRYYVD